MILNILAVLITLILASFYDLKQKTVPGLVLYPLLIVGGISTLIFMATEPHVLFRYSTLILASLWIVIGVILNRMKVLGGADILLICGIILITPVELLSIDFFLIFGFITCITGLIYYFILKLTSKNLIESNDTIKFVPCISVGYVLTVGGVYGAQVLAALAGLF